MLTEIYIEALLVNEDLADQVWELWDAGIISEELAAIAWLQVGCSLDKFSCQSFISRCKNKS